MKRGQQAKDVSAHEAEEAKKRSEQRKQGSAYRFFLKKGEDANIVILDASFDSIPFFYEHNLQDSAGKWNVFEPCVKEFAECPICQGFGQRGNEARGSYYAMFLSIIDTSGYEKQDGTFVPFDRKLLVVKQGQHNEFFRILEAAQKNHGTIRGLELTMSRDEGKNSSSIGSPVMQEDNTMYIMNTEDDLLNDFSHDAVVNSQGATILEADQMLQPYDYGKLFPKPDADALRIKYGAPAVAGSQAADDEGWEDSPESSGRGGRGRGRNRNQPPQQQPADSGSNNRRNRNSSSARTQAQQEPPAQEPQQRSRKRRSAGF